MGGGLNSEVRHRIQCGWMNWRKLSSVLCDKEVSCSLKGKLYKSVVRPAMLYGAETWEELIASIRRKLNTLHIEQVAIREEISQNDILGQDITARVEELAKQNEIEKYRLHVEELDKIINLLLSLSGRLARAQNALTNLSDDVSHEEKKILEAKRDKLREQHEDACRLKESIDRRSQQVSTFLHQYLTEEEYADYDHFIKMKSKLLMDAREIEDKIKLGEEQLSTLCNRLDWLTWKRNAS
ncbi:protein Shroom2-like [Centruroides sculpturatus]|uniref:protein Shroom2-like n=1 Tax=Centruroides sculpturatus TaxID=218467 RepID=UPI000C6E458F|nr:protein Shroom2-like [Centruroides sculpturatus]